MMRWLLSNSRPFNILACLSMAAFVASTVAFVGAAVDPQNPMRLTTTGQLIGWTGQQIALEWRSPRVGGSESAAVPVDAIRKAPGVIYAHGAIGGPASPTDYRLLLIHLWWPMLLTAIVPGLWAIRATRRSAAATPTPEWP